MDGRVTFHLDGDIFVWGGFLLDLGCALATWLDDRPPKFRFLPVEQANPVVIEVIDGRVAVHSGYQSVVVPLATATAGFRSFLEQLSDAATASAEAGSTGAATLRLLLTAAVPAGCSIGATTHRQTNGACWDGLEVIDALHGLRVTREPICTGP